MFTSSKPKKPETMFVQELKLTLAQNNLPTKGEKTELVERWVFVFVINIALIFCT